MKGIAWILAFASALAVACTSSTAANEQEEILILEVAAEKVPCVGEMEDMCIQVRIQGEDEWQIFYDPIEGFEHEEGTQYTLEVGRRRVKNPPADGSAYVYRLIRIIAQGP
jgi:hypothetical protein